MIKQIKYISEPNLMFGMNQTCEDPRDGLSMYGPYEKWGNGFGINNYSICAGVIGTWEAIKEYSNFVNKLKAPIISKKKTYGGLITANHTQRPSFPGFEAVFDINWPIQPEITIAISLNQILTILNEKNKNLRANKLVNLYLEKMLKASSDSDTRVNIWFVLVPKQVYIDCCPNSKGTKNSSWLRKHIEAEKLGQQSLFTQEDIFGENIDEYLDTSCDFHHLLKARANQERLSAPIQVIIETKLKFIDPNTNFEYGDDMKAFLAWCLSTTLYYKMGKKPWKLANMRSGVCYLGLVFKKFPEKENKKMACSAAQLFLADGDGSVFRGNNGLWMSEKNNEFHLDRQEAFNLMTLALTDYHDNHNDYPNELFIHGRAIFSDDEWSGFQDAINKHNAKANLVGVVIRDDSSFKLFRDSSSQKSNYGSLRGISAKVSDSEAYLVTTGFVPRLNTSLSMGVPNPLKIKVTRGNADIDQVLADVLALTKLNYNSCLYGDGKPVTLRFSDEIGSILTATENWKEEKRQFMYYI